MVVPISLLSLLLLSVVLLVLLQLPAVLVIAVALAVLVTLMLMSGTVSNVPTHNLVNGEGILTPLWN